MDSETKLPALPSVPVVVQLRSPIQFGKDTITELVIRPATAKDFRNLPVRTDYMMDTILSLAGRLSGQVTQVIDQLAGEDLAEVLAAVTIFFQASLGTGTTHSPS